MIRENIAHNLQRASEIVAGTERGQKEVESEGCVNENFEGEEGS